MPKEVTMSELRSACSDYGAVAKELGFQVVESAFREHVLNASLRRDCKLKLFVKAANGPAKGAASARALAAVNRVGADLASLVRRRLNGRLPSTCRTAGAHARLQQLAKALASLPADDRSNLAGAVNRTPHRQFLAPRELPVSEFHKVLKAYAGEQTIARARLVAHLHKVLRKRGIRMSPDSIEERLRSTTKVRRVPACLVEIVRSLDDRFLTGLVPIETMAGEEEPREWLDKRRGMFCFRSRNAMHKAIAEATSCNYESVHKALTRPRKGQRVQLEIRNIIADWEKIAARGEPLPVKPQYLGVPLQKLSPVLTEIECLYVSRVRMCREVARGLHVKPSAVRKWLREDNGNNCLSMEAAQSLEQLLQQKRTRAQKRSYLTTKATRRLAAELSHKAEKARAAWGRNRQDPSLRDAFRRLRLRLIIAIKRQLTSDALCPKPLCK